MKILLISPLLLDEYLSRYKSKTKALLHKIISKRTYHWCLSLAIIAAVTPKEHQVEIQQVNYNEINFDGDYDLVGISCHSSTDSNYSFKIADEFRKRGITVVMGGWHPSALPEEAKQHVDSVVIGEGEEIWPELLKDFEKGRLKTFYRQNSPVDVTLIPIPKTNSIKGLAPAVQATRGCPYQCEFCAETIMNYRKIFRPRPIENVIREIKSFHSRFFIFHDASLTIDPEYTKILFKNMKDLKKHFFCNGNADTLSKDDELLTLAKDAGCVGWLIGFESISQKSLNSFGKKTNKVVKYNDAINKIHDHDMMVSGSFVFGFDGDTLDIFNETKEFVKASNIDLPDTMILTPFPGTPLYRRLENEGRILTKDWTKYDYRHVVFQPKHITPEELFENTEKLHEEFFSVWNMTRRTFKSMKLGYLPFASTLFQNITLATMEMGITFSN
jgi:radical SAM superfamily enzyme YgiQ (UPF0313 family)